MREIRDLFKKVRVTKGTFHVKMGTVKDRNDMDIIEPEDIKKGDKNTQNYTKKKQKHNDLDNYNDHSSRDRHPGMQSHVALRKHHYEQLGDVMQFQLSYFKS